MKVTAVAGAGQMGSGIAQVLLEGGFDVLLYVVSTTTLTRAVDAIEKRLKKKVEQGLLTESGLVDMLSRLEPATTLSQLSGCQIVIEAIPEDEQLKKQLFAQLDETLADSAIIATNTSSLSVTALAAATARPHRVIGLHFMNPAPNMELVEVVRGATTSEETFELAGNLVEALGKRMIQAADYPGFVINRILYPMLNEAIYALYEGIASAEDIDSGMMLGTGQPMGPLALTDFIGLDTLLAIGRSLQGGFGDAKFRPCPLLVQKVAAGHLGRKTGRGFFPYG